MYGNFDAGYDRTIMYSPDGRIIQAEYAREAVRRGSSVIALKCNDGIVILAEKRSYSKLIEPNSKIEQIDDNLFLTFSGLIADSKVLIREAQVFSQINKITYGEECDVESLAWHLSSVAQKITQFGGRPFGVTIIIAGINNEKPELTVIEPSGAKYNAKAIAIGNSENKLMDYLEKNYTEKMTLNECKEFAMKTLSSIKKDNIQCEMLIMELNNKNITKTSINLPISKA